MLKICTVLFVASMTSVLPAQAARQSDIAQLLDSSAAPEAGSGGQMADDHRLASERLNAACPQLPLLRTTDLSTALATLYRPADFAPMWDNEQRLETLDAELKKLEDDGLVVADYGPLQAPVSSDVCAELQVSSQYLQALEHLSRGRLDQQAQEPMWSKEDASLLTPAPFHWLQPDLSDIEGAFSLARPDLDLYQQLRQLYIQLREEPREYESISTGELIRPGEQDERLPQLAARLAAAGYLAQEPAQPEQSAPEQSGSTQAEANGNTANTLTPSIEKALKDFQEDHGLKTDGVLGPNTLAALNMTHQERLDLIRINLERLRWINALMEDEVLLVNTARNRLRHYQAGDMIWQTKVISGRPGRETPSMVSKLNRITLNPDWTVPPTIRREDMIPEIRQDLGYLEREGLILLDYQGNRLDPQEVNWSDPRGVMIRQPPGPENPLGQVVFRFDNEDAIYLHDTPSRQLFSRAARNLSSGCVRVEDAAHLADVLFSRMDSAKQAKVERQRASQRTHEVSVQDGPQVILGYWTAEADAEGRLLLTQDPYGKDEALLTAWANH